MRILNAIQKFKIEKLCKMYNIHNYTINNDLSVDVESFVTLSFLYFSKIPIKFNTVNSNFWIYSNRLTTLENSPRTVGNIFGCQSNRLRNLENGPNIVGTLDCSNNLLTTLKGMPKVNDFMDCTNNNISDIYDIVKVPGYIAIYDNPVYVLIAPFINRNDKNDWIEFFNDCDIIRGDDRSRNREIIWDRLVFFYDYLDISVGKDFENWIGHAYNIIK